MNDTIKIVMIMKQVNKWEAITAHHENNYFTLCLFIQRDAANYVIVDCIGYSWGRNCSQSCQCNKQHTEYCNKENGTCFCKTGWTGKDCDEDIKKCSDAENCPTNVKQCNEQNGTFECICNDGFFLSEVGRKRDCIRKFEFQHICHKQVKNFPLRLMNIIYIYILLLLPVD